MADQKEVTGKPVNCYNQVAEAAFFSISCKNHKKSTKRLHYE
jgi:hypothetical protein